jgi:hypothetical protein
VEGRGEGVGWPEHGSGRIEGTRGPLSKIF